MARGNLLSVNGLEVEVDGKRILKGVNLEINRGEVHAIMGPNGSGKSTLSNVIMGHPKYKVTKGEILFEGKDLLKMSPDERSRAGVFLAFQYPKEIAGVTLSQFLMAAYNACVQGDGKRISAFKFKKMLGEHMEKLKIDPAMADRYLNHGFSGGEKKKSEVLQMSVLAPTLCLLDETDSGLDVDALRIVAKAVGAMRSDSKGFLLVTHYQRILQYLKPDFVHVMLNGKIVKSGDHLFAAELEKKGYESLSKFSIVK